MVYPRVVKLDGYDLASRRPIGEVRMSYRLLKIRHALRGSGSIIRVIR